MKSPDTIPPKPRSLVSRVDITRLPDLTRGRRLARRLVILLARFLTWIGTRTKTIGPENLPRSGPALVVGNHLGDADFVIGLARSPIMADAFAKAELATYPLLGWILEAYGVIWIHRGQPDRRALKAALQGFKEGRVIGIAPEGRESLIGGLEEGTGGAAYLASKADVPVIPITFTGTENWRVYGNLKRFRRTDVTLTIGRPFKLEQFPDRREEIARGTQKIMLTLAAQLPEEYRGIYQGQSEVLHELER